MIHVDFFSQPTKLLLKIIIHSLSCSYCNSYLSYALQSFLSNLKIILTFALHFLCLMNAFFFILSLLTCSYHCLQDLLETCGLEEIASTYT